MRSAISSILMRRSLYSSSNFRWSSRISPLDVPVVPASILVEQGNWRESVEFVSQLAAASLVQTDLIQVFIFRIVSPVETSQRGQGLPFRFPCGPGPLLRSVEIGVKTDLLMRLGPAIVVIVASLPSGSLPGQRFQVADIERRLQLLRPIDADGLGWRRLSVILNEGIVDQHQDLAVEQLLVDQEPFCLIRSRRIFSATSWDIRFHSPQVEDDRAEIVQFFACRSDPGARWPRRSL